MNIQQPVITEKDRAVAYSFAFSQLMFGVEEGEPLSTRITVFVRGIAECLCVFGPILLFVDNAMTTYIINNFD